jgi:glycosyltransferase involved in cell wall biosynthesis
MNQKILTIVVPVYNMEDCLNRCLDSLLISSQELMQMLEVIVVNDGSTDGTSALAHSYEARFPGVFFVIDKENGNSGSCINAALEVATGKYFRQLDADDWLDTKVLEQFIPLLMEREEDCVSTPHKNVYDDGGFTLYDAHSVVFGRQYLVDDVHLQSGEGGVLTMHSLTFRLDLLRRIGHRQQENIQYTDIEQCYFPLTAARDIVFYNICLYQYYHGREGQAVSPGNVRRNRSHMLRVTQRLADDYAARQTTLSANRRRILKRLILLTMYPAYVYYLLYDANEPDFLKLDRQVTSLPDLNNMAEGFQLKGMPFAKLWHDHGLVPQFLLYV